MERGQFENQYDLSPIVVPDDYIKAVMPKEWFFERFSADEESHIYITRSRIDQRGHYRTGLHIKIYRNFVTAQNLPIDEYIRQILENESTLYPINEPVVKNDYPLIISRRKFIEGSVKEEKHNGSENICDLIIKPGHYQYLEYAANRETKTAYFARYRTPWKDTYNIELGNKMLEAIEFSRFV